MPRGFFLHARKNAVVHACSAMGKTVRSAFMEPINLPWTSKGFGMRTCMQAFLHTFLFACRRACKKTCLQVAGKEISS